MKTLSVIVHTGELVGPLLVVLLSGRNTDPDGAVYLLSRWLKITSTL